MANNRVKNNIQHLTPTLMTWQQLHQEMQKEKNHFSRQHLNKRIEQEFNGILKINYRFTYPYFEAFKSLSTQKVKSLIPQLNKPIGSLMHDGNYQNVYDIYKVIIDGTTAGFRNQRGKVSASFVERALSIKNAHTPKGIKNFLNNRGYTLQSLIEHAANYHRAVTQSTEENNTAALKQLNIHEAHYIEELKKSEMKRVGPIAYQNNAHLDQSALAQGVIKRKSPIYNQPNKTIKPAKNNWTDLPASVVNMESVKKQSFSLFKPTETSDKTRQTVGKKRPSMSDQQTPQKRQRYN